MSLNRWKLSGKPPQDTEGCGLKYLYITYVGKALHSTTAFVTMEQFECGRPFIPEEEMPGGISEVRDADDEIRKICAKVRPFVEEKFSTIFPKFTAVKYTQRTVNRYKRCIKVHVGDQNYLHIYVYEDPSGAQVLLDADEWMSEDSPLK